MARKQVNIDIFASDKASAVFGKIAREAGSLEEKLRKMAQASLLPSAADLQKNLLRVASAPKVFDGLGASISSSLKAAMREGAFSAPELDFGGKALKRTLAEFEELGVSIDARSRQLQGLGARMRDVARENAFKNLKEQAGLSTMEMVKLRNGLGDTRGAVREFGRGLASSGVTIAAWAASLTLMGKACFDAALQVDRLEKAYAAINGTEEAGRVHLRELYDTTQRLGLQFYDSAEGAKMFFAAMQNTAIAGQANMVFEGVAAAVSALSLSGEDAHRVFRALGQMVSKGKIQAEDLRQQMGESLPGAFQLMAKALGMTTAQLDKALELGQVLADDAIPKLGRVLNEEFAEKAKAAAEGMQGAVNRLSTEWETFKANIINSEAAIAVLKGIRNLLAGINEVDNITDLEEKMRKAGVKPDVPTYAADGMTVLSWGYSDEARKKYLDSIKAKASADSKLVEQENRHAAILATLRSKEDSILENSIEGRIRRKKQEIEEYRKLSGEWIVELVNLGDEAAVQMQLAREAKTVSLLEKQLDDLRNGGKSKKSDFRGPETIDRDYAGEAIAELRKKAEGQEKKDFKQETRDLDMVADVMQELAEKTGQYHLAVGSVNELIDRQGELWRNAGVPQNYVDQLKEVRRLEASREGWAGAMLATRQYYSEATNMAEAYKGVVTNAFGGMEDAIVNACMTGKLSFTDMVNSMIADLMRLMVRQSITGPLAGALGNMIGGIFNPSASAATANASSWSGNFNVGASLGYTPTGIGHDGWGLVGSSRPSNGYRLVPSGLFANAPRFHGGTGFVKPGEYPAILKAGERVLNPAETRAYQSRREPTVNVNIVNSTGQQAATRTRSDNHGNKTIDVYVGDMAAKQMATPGTTLNRAVSAQTGTKRPAIRR